MSRAILCACLFAGGCVYYAVPAGTAERIQAMPPGERASSWVRVTREPDQAEVLVRAGALRLPPLPARGPSVRGRRPAIHPATTAGIAIAAVGAVFLVVGGVVAAVPGSPPPSSSSCDICGLSYGLGVWMAEVSMFSVGGVHLFGGLLSTAIGATRPSQEIHPGTGP